MKEIADIIAVMIIVAKVLGVLAIIGFGVVAWKVLVE